MKKYFFFFCTLLSIPHYLLAQKEIISTATELIVAGKFEAADRYLDSLLKKNRKQVDALMMKGNVILNRELRSIPPISLSANADESVFTSGMGEISETIRIVPVGTARSIEKWWKKCLKEDKKRLDVHKGLCTLYAMALMKEELKWQISELLKVEQDESGEQAYSLAEYARKLKERDRFDDAIEVYEFIARRFPNLAGIRCDIGSEFFYDGRMNDALRYLDSALSKKNVDESTFLNAAFIYSELGYYENAYRCFAGYSKRYNSQMDVFYKGLMLFADTNKQYADTLISFLNSIDTNAYYPEYLLAEELVRHPSSFSMADYERIITGEHPEWYLPLVYQRAMRQFGDSCKPFVDYGIFQSRIKNYPAAVQFLEEGENCRLPTEWSEYWIMYYAYALYQSGMKEKALRYFYPLTYSAHHFRRQAARYFAAKVMLENKQTESAVKLLKENSEAEETTKYKALSIGLLQTLK